MTEKYLFDIYWPIVGVDKTSFVNVFLSFGKALKKYNQQHYIL